MHIDTLDEIVVRRSAKADGLLLRKFRGSPQDSRAGTFMLVSAETGAVVHAAWSTGYGLDLDDVMAFCRRWSGRND